MSQWFSKEKKSLNADATWLSDGIKLPQQAEGQVVNREAFDKKIIQLVIYF